MTDKEQLITNIVTVANTVEVVKKTLAKVGLQFLAPLGESMLDEKISKAIVGCVQGASK
jgi:hypothetical protein